MTNPRHLHPAENPLNVASLARRLCPYPEVARYTGIGDPNSAANFVCAVEDIMMATTTETNEDRD